MDETKPNIWSTQWNMPQISGSEMKWTGSRLYGSKDFINLKLDSSLQMYFEFISDNNGQSHNGKTALLKLELANKEYSDFKKST